MIEHLPVLTFAVICFAGGYGWGQFMAERRLRAEATSRMQISMPMKPEHAKDTMRLLTSIIEQVEREQQQVEAKPEPICKFCVGTGKQPHVYDGSVPCQSCRQQAEGE